VLAIRSLIGSGARLLTRSGAELGVGFGKNPTGLCLGKHMKTNWLENKETIWESAWFEVWNSDCHETWDTLNIQIGDQVRDMAFDLLWEELRGR